MKRLKYAMMKSRRTWRRRQRRANRVRRIRTRTRRRNYGLRFGSRGYNSRRE